MAQRPKDFFFKLQRRTIWTSIGDDQKNHQLNKFNVRVKLLVFFLMEKAYFRGEKHSSFLLMIRGRWMITKPTYPNFCHLIFLEALFKVHHGTVRGGHESWELGVPNACNECNGTGNDSMKLNCKTYLDESEGFHHIRVFFIGSNGPLCDTLWAKLATFQLGFFFFFGYDHIFNQLLGCSWVE